MCGRYLVTSPVDAMAALFGFPERPNLAPRWNLAPTQQAPVVRPAGAGGRTLAFCRWGLVPAWSKGPVGSAPLINARGETVAEKPSFRDAFKAGRCLVPADGFYEWSGAGAARQAYFLKPPGPIGFAGVAARWVGPDGAVLESFAIVTTEATGPIAAIHHRSPVVIASADHDAWLNAPPAAAAALIRPPPEALFEAVPVDGRVGNVREDDAGLIAPAAPAPKTDGQMRLF